MIDEKVLCQEEKISLKLRNLYSSYGYGCYKMNKFEEYDLYSSNKSFLLSDSVIAFTDTNGKMMALKPDVTLSIAKNTKPQSGEVIRLFYDENVYRVSQSVGRYKEINQVGLECIGSLSEYNFFEVLCLAALSLNKISPRSLLTVSDLGIISSVLDKIQCDVAPLVTAISQKNRQAVVDFCNENVVDSQLADILVLLLDTEKTTDEILELIKEKSTDKSVITTICQLQDTVRKCREVTGAAVEIDLTAISDLNYYNGLIFSGYIMGIPTRVLSGGRYDKLITKLGKSGCAIGFAVYLDILERFNATVCDDTDIVLLYGDDSDISKVFSAVTKLGDGGKKVIALKNIPEGLTYGKIVEFKGGKNV